VGFNNGHLNGGRPSACHPLPPAELYINGGAPKKQRVGYRGREGGRAKPEEGNTKIPA